MNKSWIAVIGAFAVGVYLPLEPSKPKPTTYEDCVLEHLSPGLAKDAIGLIHRACDGKFRSKPAPSTTQPKTTVPVTWAEVITTEAFHHASPETRGIIRQFFFEWVMLPEMPNNDITQLVRADFYAHTQPDVMGNE